MLHSTLHLLYPPFTLVHVTLFDSTHRKEKKWEKRMITRTAIFVACRLCKLFSGFLVNGRVVVRLGLSSQRRVSSSLGSEEIWDRDQMSVNPSSSFEYRFVDAEEPPLQPLVTQSPDRHRFHAVRCLVPICLCVCLSVCPSGWLVYTTLYLLNAAENQRS